MDWIKVAAQYGLPTALLGVVLAFLYYKVWPLMVSSIEANKENLRRLTDSTIEIQKDTQKAIASNSAMHAKNMEMIERLLRGEPKRERIRPKK